MATKIVCDRCGKEIDVHKKHIYGEAQVLYGNPEIDEDIHFDLCFNCFKELKKWVNK